MLLFPAERFVIDAPAAPAEVRDRLSGAPFAGTVGVNSFDLRPVLGYRNSFAPTVRGSFASSISGTRVETSLRIVPAVGVLMAVWLSLAGAFFIGALAISFRNTSQWPLPVIGFVLFAFGYLLMTLAFSFEARRIRTNMRLLLSGTPAGDLPRTDLSWLTSLRLRNAEVPERRFNRIFLTMYGISGVLTFLTWDRTVTACSNFEYNRRHEYSCPSDARIALTWALGGVVVASGLTSRVALHKRARRLYIPLLVLAAALAAGAGWLITHHSRWGVPR
jgi:hypothetical protein